MKNYSNILKKLGFVLPIIIVLIIIDLVTKEIAQANLQFKPSVTYLGGFIKLVYAENTGGMLSFGSSIPEFFKVLIFQFFVFGLLLFLLGYIVYKDDLTKIQTSAFLLFLGGGFGNLIDRFFNDGKVIDFILLQAGGIHTGIFNVADMYVTTGVGLILVAAIMEKYSERKNVEMLKRKEAEKEEHGEIENVESKNGSL
ncbi:MAG: signal peptidase II [Ignavibacteriae bacterium]|nr:signal peptidase II [Ignavibacteriota bacterium]NOG99328.1 signal peptidase II [Ignavibacteriota bacterium]